MRPLLTSRLSTLKHHIYNKNREGAEGEKGMEHSGFRVFRLPSLPFSQCGSILCTFVIAHISMFSRDYLLDYL
jgi:hypothetical protein